MRACHYVLHRLVLVLLWLPILGQYPIITTRTKKTIQACLTIETLRFSIFTIQGLLPRPSGRGDLKKIKKKVTTFLKTYLCVHMVLILLILDARSNYGYKGPYRPGRLGLLNPCLDSTLGCKSSRMLSSDSSLGSSTSNFFSGLTPATWLAASTTARFIKGYIIRYLIDLFPGVLGQV
jgi:hypothetical protein